MAVKSIGLKNAATSGERIYDPLSTSGTRKTYRDTYLVTVDSTADSEDQVLIAAGIPNIGDFGRNGWCVAKSAREVSASALLWEVTCEFDSQPPVVTSNYPDLLQWSWSAEDIDLVVFRDVFDGRPIANSVGEKFTVTTPVAIPVLTVTRIENSFSPLTILNYVNTTNGIPFYGAPIDTALMTDIRDEHAVIDGFYKRRVTYVIKFNLIFDYETGTYPGWTVRPLDIGTRYYEQANNALSTKSFLADGVPTQGFLNPDGTRRSTPKFLKFHTHLRRNFNALALGPYGY